MERQKRFFFMSLASMLLAGGIISSCGTSSDDLADNENGIDGIVDRNDDNGTGVGNTGGDGKTLIEDSKEKKFIEETGQVLSSYLNAAETEQLTEVYKEITKLDKGELDDLADLLFEETAITRAYSEVINYHNVIVSATNVKGKYTASYGGKWKKIAESDNLIMEYTDSHNAVWLLTASAQGKMGRVYTDIRKESYTYSQTVQGDYITTYDRRYYIIEVPKVSNVLLTHDNISDETVVKNCVAKMNNCTNGYLTNNGGDAHQAILKFGIKPSSKSVYMYNSDTYTDYYTYDITPILQFHDGSSYLVEDYFSETTFQNVYDKIETFLRNVENQLK